MIVVTVGVTIPKRLMNFHHLSREILYGNSWVSSGKGSTNNGFSIIYKWRYNQ
jgi:hypothetical protein